MVGRGLVRIGGCVLFCRLLVWCVVVVAGVGDGGGWSNGAWAWWCVVVCVVFWVGGDAGAHLWLLLVDGAA